MKSDFNWLTVIDVCLPQAPWTWLQGLQDAPGKLRVEWKPCCYEVLPDIHLQINPKKTELKDSLFSEIFIKMCKRCTWLWNKTWNIASNFWYTHCQQQGNASEINTEDTFPYCTKAAWIGRFNNAYSLMHIRSTASSKVELNKFITHKKKKKRHVAYQAFSLSDL